MNIKISSTIFLLIVILLINSCVKQKPISSEQSMDDNGPLTYQLGDKYPNPFCPNTTIKYSIPESVQVTIIIYNILGEIVDTVENQFKAPGTYKVEWDAVKFTSGVYFYKLTAGKFTKTKKMVLLKQKKWKTEVVPH